MVPLAFEDLAPDEQLRRAEEFLALLARRRSVREFSSRPVPRVLMEKLVRSAAGAPSGANKQPWKFVVVDDPELKRKIREGAEEEEKASYGGRMPQSWLDDLAPLGTDWRKPFLEEAPWLIVVFKERFREEEGERKKNYYVEESVGIACGFLIAAVHNAGLACLTHTPSPMDFLRDILGRPRNESPFLLLPVGYPRPDAQVPDIRRKPAEEVLIWNRGE